jgi:hypothetical protein
MMITKDANGKNECKAYEAMQKWMMMDQWFYK